MNKFKRFVEYFFSMTLLAIVWHLYVVLFNVPAYMLPTPIEVSKSVYSLILSDNIIYHFSITLSEVVIGFIIGTFLGLVMGYIIAKVKILEDALMPYIIMAQTAPKIALAPLFVIWFGLGLFSKLVLIISMVFFPIMLGTIFGIRGVSYNLKSLMKITGLNWWQRIVHVELPQASPFIFSGFKLGMVQAAIAAIVAEWISGQAGLGFLLTFMSTTYNTTGLFATIIYTILMGVILYQAINILEKRFLHWHESKQYM